MDRFVDHMRQCQVQTNAEIAHIEADFILLDLIRTLGYNELADEYEKVKRWYS